MYMKPTALIEHFIKIKKRRDQTMSGPFCGERVMGSTTARKNGYCTRRIAVGIGIRRTLHNHGMDTCRNKPVLGTEDPVFTCRTISSAVFACDDVFLHDVFLLLLESLYYTIYWIKMQVFGKCRKKSRKKTTVRSGLLRYCAIMVLLIRSKALW